MSPLLSGAVPSRRAVMTLLAMAVALPAGSAHAGASRADASRDALSRFTSCGLVPAAMRAARVHGRDSNRVLRVDTVPVPAPRVGHVLVRVHAASVNPVDWKLQDGGDLAPLSIPGGDFAGEVVAVGAGVQAFRCGDRVAGTVDQAAQSGSYAEYVVAPTEAIVRKPAAYRMEEAAAYPTVAIAAWRFLIAGANVQRGERVLVHGAAGGVGSMVVQMAKARGAFVIGTASARNHDYLRQIGADSVIDYTRTPFESVVRGVDVVVDAVGGETLARSYGVLRPGGRLVSSAGAVDVARCAALRIACPSRAPWDVARGLAYAARLIDGGALRVHVDSVYSLSDVQAAQQHSRSGRTRGKVVITMEAGESAAAMVPLQAYLDGHATGSAAAFARAFAADAMLVGIKDGEYRQWPAAEYIRLSSSGRAPADESRRRRRVESLRITGRVATAVIALDYPDMVARDHMTLLNRNGEWRIVVKAYDAYTPKP
jgi:NADPH:quinone reductase-like Zn-dependent oxidoreductase